MGSDFNLKKCRLRLDIGQIFFTVWEVRHWNRLLKEVVEATCLEVFQARLDGALATWFSGRHPCPWQGGRKSLPTQTML